MSSNTGGGVGGSGANEREHGCISQLLTVPNEMVRHTDAAVDALGACGYKPTWDRDRRILPIVDGGLPICWSRMLQTETW